MFARIKRFKKNNTTYEYLVISKSIYKEGKGSYTKDIANLGNIKSFDSKNIDSMIDSLIRLYKSEKFVSSDDIEILESLEYGNIIFWKKIWDKLKLSKLIKKEVAFKDKRIELEVEKYVEMMTINRCINPLSKLGATRWIPMTCYKEMKGYSTLSLDVTFFYRSMDYLLLIKDELERNLYDKMKNLFSITVKMTFYDITSSYFYAENCPIGAHGYSRDHRPDKVQIIVGVVTSYEGYPIKHYVFEGNTKDETTVMEVLKYLKENYNIEETIFVGDRGMITKLNQEQIIKNGYDYIMGVKTYQDELCQMLLSEEQLSEDKYVNYKKLKVQEKIITVKSFLKWKIKNILIKEKVTYINSKLIILEKHLDILTNNKKTKYIDFKQILRELAFKIDNKVCYKLYRIIKKYEGKYEEQLRYIICLNEERRKSAQETREEYILKISEELDSLYSADKKEKDIIILERTLNKIFEGYKNKYKKFYQILRDKGNKKSIGYQLNKDEIKASQRLDGIFVLVTSRTDLKVEQVIESYKNLQEVEILFDDFKNFVDVRPIRHWLEKRVRAHVFICILSLLLKRIFEINYLNEKAVTEVLEEITKSKLIKYKLQFSKKEERSKIVLKVTNTTPLQRKYFKMVGIKNPENLEKLDMVLKEK